MKRILKYKFEKDWWDLQLELSAYSYPVAFELVGGEPTFWVCEYVDVGHPTRKYDFKIVGTGFTFDDSWTHCYTIRDGPYVWHLLWRENNEVV